MKEYIGKVALDDTFYQGQERETYSDHETEEELLKIVSGHSEKEYNRIISEKKSAVILYELSHMRQNLVEWLPIAKEHTVLEIGAGCGAVTGALSDKAQRVICIEPSRKRSVINATRHQHRDNIRILPGSFWDAEQGLTEQFDWITLIGGFARGHDIGRKNSCADFLRRLKRYMKPGGAIVIATSNRLGLKYFAGCAEDHTGKYFEGIEGGQNSAHPHTFSRPQLEKIFSQAALSQWEFYYPYPDYRLPMAIYSDHYLPKVGELRDNQKNYGRERYLLFDETKAFDSIIKDGLFPVFSNSYLVVCRE